MELKIRVHLDICYSDKLVMLSLGKKLQSGKISHPLQDCIDDLYPTQVLLLLIFLVYIVKGLLMILLKDKSQCCWICCLWNSRKNLMACQNHIYSDNGITWMCSCIAFTIQKMSRYSSVRIEVLGRCSIFISNCQRRKAKNCCSVRYAKKEIDNQYFLYGYFPTNLQAASSREEYP